MLKVHPHGPLSESALVNFFVPSLRPLPWLLFLFSTFYAAHLTSFQVPVDAEIAGMRAATSGPDMLGHAVWAQQGRWGIYLIERFLVPQPVVPFFPLGSFGFFVSIGYLLFLIAFGKTKISTEGYLLFPVFSAFPTWYFLIQFPANLLATGIGVTLSGVFVVALRATILIGRDTYSNHKRTLICLYAVQCVAAILAISVYQSFAVLIAVSGIGVIIAAAIDTKTSPLAVVAQIFILGITIVVSILCYVIIFKIFLIILNIKPVYIYLFFHPEFLREYFSQTIVDTIVHLAGVYGGSRDVYGLAAWSFVLVPIVSLFALASTNRLTGQPAMRAIVLAAWAVILLVPFAQNLLSRGAMPYRSLISVPISLWFCAFISFEIGGKLIRRAMAAVVILVLVQALYIFALFEGSEAIARQYDRRLAEAIYTRVLLAREAANASLEFDVAFFGKIPLSRNIYMAPEGETVGRSIFGWGDNSTRIISLYQFLGFPGMRAISDQKRSDLRGEFMTMDVWPAPNSIRIVGNITLVKLSSSLD